MSSFYIVVDRVSSDPNASWFLHVHRILYPDLKPPFQQTNIFRYTITRTSFEIEKTRKQVVLLNDLKTL